MEGWEMRKLLGLVTGCSGRSKIRERGPGSDRFGRPTARLIATLLCAALATDSLAAIRGDSAAYVGGTVPALKRGVEGSLDTTNEKELQFHHKGGDFAIPYRSIESLEFGQKVGRRVGAALGGMLALGLPGLIILASKKKKHY